MSLCKELVDNISKIKNEVMHLRNKTTMKSDGSFVSEGDLLVQDTIMKYLSINHPSYQLISEELAPFTGITWDIKKSYVILDPIDGTENFISGLKEWGVGISVYSDGKHQESCIYLPELNDIQITGMPIVSYKSRIRGLSSSLTKKDLLDLEEGYEYRIVGCSMYNMLSAVRGSFASFENIKGVNCWDILPGLNLGLEHGCEVFVDGKPYNGEILFPTQKYKIFIKSRSKDI